MLQIAIIVSLCLGILGTWFLLRIELAEALLMLMVLSAAAAGIYWLWTGGWDTEIDEGVGIFTLLIIILGALRLGIEKFSDMLSAMRPPPFGTKSKT